MAVMCYYLMKMIYYPFSVTRSSGCNTDIYYKIVINVTQLSEAYQNGPLKFQIIGDISMLTSVQKSNKQVLTYNDVYNNSISGVGYCTLYVDSISLNTTEELAIIFRCEFS